MAPAEAVAPKLLVAHTGSTEQLQMNPEFFSLAWNKTQMDSIRQARNWSSQTEEFSQGHINIKE